MVMVPSNGLFDKTTSNMQEVTACGAKVILVTDARVSAAAGDNTAYQIILPSIDPVLRPILYALPVQLIAYHIGTAKGTDIGQSSNLAKSVKAE